VTKDYANSHLPSVFSKLNLKQNNPKFALQINHYSAIYKMRFPVKIQLCLVKQVVRLQLVFSVWKLFKGNILSICNNYE